MKLPHTEVKSQTGLISLGSHVNVLINNIKTENFHSFQKLLRITSSFLRFINNLKSRMLKKGVNEHKYIELHKSKLLWLKLNQRDCTSQEAFKDLENLLCLKVDENGLYQSTIRLNRTKWLPYNVKHPIILNRKRFLTNLIFVHQRIKHNGERQALDELREEFWIPRWKSFTKQVLRSCIICRKFNARPYSYPKIPDLPPERLDDQSCFSGVGIDYTCSLFC